MNQRTKQLLLIVLALVLGIAAGMVFAAKIMPSPAAPAGAGETELLERYEAGYKEGYEAGYLDGKSSGQNDSGGFGSTGSTGSTGGTQSSGNTDSSVSPDTAAPSGSDDLIEKYKSSSYVCPSNVTVTEDGWYYSKDEVALYIHTFGKLPGNFLSKKQAKNLGWSSGSLENYAPGKVIGGSQFGNNEGLLPKAKGRTYTECDIDTKGAKTRGAKRIVFSSDGLIFYTDDHYESFELLYGKDLL